MIYSDYLKINIEKLINPDMKIWGDNIFAQTDLLVFDSKNPVKRSGFRHFFEDEFIYWYNNDNNFKYFVENYNE